MREFLVLPIVVKVLRLKMIVNWAFSRGKLREANAGCWMLGQGPPGAGALPLGVSVTVRLDRAQAISPSTIL